MLPNYGSNQTLTPPPDLYNTLDPYDIKNIQEIIGVSLYYGCSVYATILLAVRKISSHNLKPQTKSPRMSPNWSTIWKLIQTPKYATELSIWCWIYIAMHLTSTKKHTIVGPAATELLVHFLPMPSTNCNRMIPCQPKMATFWNALTFAIKPIITSPVIGKAPFIAV